MGKGTPVILTHGSLRTHRLWREARNFKRVILRNRGHLSSYMAGLAPELYRDTRTEFIVSNNPK